MCRSVITNKIYPQIKKVWLIHLIRDCFYNDKRSQRFAATFYCPYDYCSEKFITLPKEQFLPLKHLL